MSDVPVLIVGGGPSGLAAAIELGRRGIEVCVVEPRTTLDPLRARAKTTSVRTMEHLRRWGRRPLARGGAAAGGACPGRRVLHALAGARDHPLPRGVRSHRRAARRVRRVGPAGAAACRRAGAEDAAAALPTVTVLMGSRVTRVVDGSDDVRADVQHPTGEVQEIVADWLLGCDGSGGYAGRLVRGTRAYLGCCRMSASRSERLSWTGKRCARMAFTTG